MYCRMLAAQLLSKEIGRFLCLDPDMLIINSIRPLYETELDGFLCCHP